jgi:predicted nucleic acid-binding Zn ribbon protein
MEKIDKILNGLATNVKKESASSSGPSVPSATGFRKRVAPRPRSPMRSKSEPTAIDKVLAGVLSKGKLGEGVQRYRFVQFWPEIIGEELAKVTYPECLRRGTLVIRVTSSIWAQELSFQKATILERLSKFLGDHEEVWDVAFYSVGDDLRPTRRNRPTSRTP